jgi:hypothetical protein
VSVVRGTVINIHHHGATVRLDDGSLAAVSALELASHRAAYEGSLAAKTPLELILDASRRHALVVLERAVPAPVAPEPHLAREAFETQINAYLKSTEAWAPRDQAEPAERHFIRKKRREAIFEARKQAT